MRAGGRPYGASSVNRSFTPNAPQDSTAKDAEVIWCPPCMAEWDTEEQSQLDTCTLCSPELPGGGSAWHVMSSCSHPGLQAQRKRMAGPFGEVVMATIKELDKGEWGHREEVAGACRQTQAGAWVAPARWAGKGGPMDDTAINPWCGLFPQEWVDGLSTGEGDARRSGELWERRRRALQRLGDCCIRMCADLWSMACFLWTAPDRVAQGAERSKRGRAWAREAASLQAADPVRLAQEIRVFKLAWESKLQTAYARWVRAEWSLS